MAISDDQYDAILARLTKLERVYNDLANAIDKFATVNQINQLLTMSQADIEALTLQVAALEQRVIQIEQDPTGGL